MSCGRSTQIKNEIFSLSVMFEKKIQLLYEKVWELLGESCDRLVQFWKRKSF